VLNAKKVCACVKYNDSKSLENPTTFTEAGRLSLSEKAKIAKVSDKSITKEISSNSIYYF
jgi:hypothetical protein